MGEIIRSVNLYVSTHRGDDTTNGKGDNMQLALNGIDICCDPGQYLRMSLQNFTMFKNWTNINKTNSRFAIKTNGTHVDNNVNLTHQNVISIHDLATDFAQKLGDAALALAVANHGSTATKATVSDILPTSSTNAAGTGNNIISFKLTYNANHNITDLKVQTYETFGNNISDAYFLLGSDKIAKASDDTDFTSQSINVTITSATEITVSCKYPAQRMSEHSVYLRTSLATNSLQTSSFSDGLLPNRPNNKVFQSDILARLVMDHEFVAFTASTGREYFIDLKETHLNNATFRLTDSHGLPLDYIPNQNKNNLCFNMSLRIDVIQNPVRLTKFESPPKQRLVGYHDKQVHTKISGLNRI